MMQRYWVSNAAQEHVHIVRDKGYTQINMGPREPLEKMNVGDWILYYSPTIYFEQLIPTCQKFTGIACVSDTRIYPQGNQQPDHWRRNVDFYHCIPHHPKHFFGKVSFLPDNSNWIEILNQPILEIPRNDFILIADKILMPDDTRILLY
jgi:hypothetical protein